MHGYYLLEMYYMKVLKSVNTSKLDILHTSRTLKAMPNNIEKALALLPVFNSAPWNNDTHQICTSLVYNLEIFLSMIWPLL